MLFTLIEEPIELAQLNAPQRIREAINRITRKGDDGWSGVWGDMSNEEQELSILIPELFSDDLIFSIDGLLIRLMLDRGTIECWIIGYIPLIRIS
jgi:hypothetical protein